MTLVQSDTTLSGSILPAGRTTATRLETGSRILADGRVFFGSEGPSNYWNDVTDAYFIMTLDPTNTRMMGACNLIFTCTSATAVKVR